MLILEPWFTVVGVMEEIEGAPVMATTVITYAELVPALVVTVTFLEPGDTETGTVHTIVLLLHDVMDACTEPIVT